MRSKRVGDLLKSKVNKHMDHNFHCKHTHYNSPCIHMDYNSQVCHYDIEGDDRSLPQEQRNVTVELFSAGAPCSSDTVRCHTGKTEHTHTST